MITLNHIGIAVEKPEALTKLFEDMFNRAGTESPKLEGFDSQEAEDEIDKLFG